MKVPPEFLPQFEIIVNLAIIREGDPAVIAVERLDSSPGVDDGQATVANPHIPLAVNSVAVGSAVG
jgi:hypothetical protein